MANVDKAFGLNPYKGNSAGSSVQIVNKYNIVTTGYGTSIFQGDLTIFSGGYINTAAASSANIVGAFSHCYYVATDGTPTFKNYYPASTTALGSGAIEAYIYDDPNQLFVVQADGASAQTCIGRNADTEGIGGSTTTGVATRELDSSTINTTAALQLKIVGVVQDDVNGDLTADNANLIVLINEHYMRGAVAGT
jgi:ABC-type amino acid transport substrate-binding protein